MYAQYRINIRKGDVWKTKPNIIEQLDGKVFTLAEGWEITSDDSTIYAGEKAMVFHKKHCDDVDISWIASGDCELIEEKTK